MHPSAGRLLSRPGRQKRMDGHGDGAAGQSAMLALTDAQLEIVMVAVGGLPVEKRSVFLERVAARLQLRGSRFTDADLGAAIQTALTGLTQSVA